MHLYCKNCKKHAGKTFPKKIVLISKNKINGKSKCAICLTGKSFIHEIEGKNGLESQLEIYFSFLQTYFMKKHEDLLRLSVEKILKI